MPPSVRKSFLLLVALLVLAPTSSAAMAATVVNGTFEGGTLAGWTTNGTSPSCSTWTADTGTTAPRSGRTISAPPEGTWAALHDGACPASDVLYQDIALEPGRTHTLSFKTYYQNDSGLWSTPQSLEVNQSNQQYRVDIMKPTSTPRSMVAGDILSVVYRTVAGDPMVRAPFDVSADLTPFAGQTVRLRFAAVQTQFFFRVGVDAVKIVSSVADGDGDGVPDSTDNCRSTPNPDQADFDLDGQGDACDGDIDGDGVANAADACAGTAAGTLVASDGCADPDGDGVSTHAGDNCAEVANADQADNEGDGIGDVCDADDDNDNVSDEAELAAGTDPLNPDTDGDGARDDADNCGTVTNADQSDLDADGLGDACDPDIDGDGVANDSDNCRSAANADQIDADDDGRGAACDTLELPRTKDDCKNGGWRSFDGTATFRNQGDCVSYVATGGRNKPAAG